MIMMYQSRFINCNKGTVRKGMEIVGEAVWGGGGKYMGELGTFCLRLL